MIVITSIEGGYMSHVLKFRTVNGMKLDALIFPLYNVNIPFVISFV